MPELNVEVTFNTGSEIDEDTLRALVGATVRGIAAHLILTSMATIADHKRKPIALVTGVTASTTYDGRKFAAQTPPLRLLIRDYEDLYHTEDIEAC